MNIYGKILLGLLWLGGAASGLMLCCLICGGYTPGIIMFCVVALLLWLSYKAQG